jgi:hypothetical protein
MSTLGKRGKIYQITNNITDDVYVGATTQALYKRLYRHKCDMEKGVESKFYDLMRNVGKDKFKIELIEEYSFSDIDALRARELHYIRERSTLNDHTARRDERGDHHQDADEDHTDTPPSKEKTERLEVDRYMKCILELQQEVRTLKMQLESITNKTQEEEPQTAQETEAQKTQEESETPKTASHTPESFDISDDENDDLTTELAEGIPTYDLTEDAFEVLRGKLDDGEIDQIKTFCDKVSKIGKHVGGHPRDAENKQELDIFKRLLAKRIICLRLEANELGLDQPCLKLLDTIEKNARFNKKLLKKWNWDAMEFRKRNPFDEDDEKTEDRG